MKKVIILMSVLIAWATSLPAGNITREQADAIVQDYVQSEVTQPATLFTNLNEPDEAGIAITTSNEETVRAKYACWAYYLDESESAQRRYLFVKEEGGSLLEVIASNDISDLGASWAAMPTGLTDNKGNSLKQLFQNPVDELLTLPCNGGENTRIEIYDLKGTCRFAGLLSGEGNCQLNVSFLNAGVYMVNISGETYKIIKK